MSTEETAINNRQRGPRSASRPINSPNHLSKSPSSRRRISPMTPKRHRPTPKPVEVFHRCYSSPMIVPRSGGGGESGGSLDSDDGGWFCRVRTLDDVMLGIDTLDIVASPLSPIFPGYQKDSKVVIMVTVEGSPGPVRTLVKLGANVDDTIKLVVQKYREEGRSPSLVKDSASFFDLYVSYFSLQCLDKSDTIGDVGTRSFYLRKSSKKSNCNGNIGEVETTSLSSSSSNEHVQGRRCHGKMTSTPLVVLPTFIARKLNKLVRRVQKLFIFLGCLHSR